MLRRGTLLPSDVSHLATSSRPSEVGGKADGEGGRREVALLPRRGMGNVVFWGRHSQRIAVDGQIVENYTNRHNKFTH